MATVRGLLSSLKEEIFWAARGLKHRKLLPASIASLRKESTIRDMLLEAVGSRPYDAARYTSVYELPPCFQEADQYLLRAPFGFFSFHLSPLGDEQRMLRVSEWLRTTSCLTPVKFGPIIEGAEHNFSQPVLEAKKFQLVKKVPGKTLFHLHGRLGETSFQEKMSALPDATYGNFLERMDWFTRHGLATDPHKRNVMLHEDEVRNPELGHIDVLSRQHMPAAHRARIVTECNNLSRLLCYPGAFAEVGRETQDRIRRIAGDMGFPLDKGAVQRRMQGDLKRGLCVFAKVREIEPLGRISLDDVPRALGIKLREIHEHTEQPKPLHY